MVIDLSFKNTKAFFSRHTQKIMQSLLAYAWGVLGALTVFVVVHMSTPKPPVIATVNITDIFDRYIKQQTTLKHSSTVMTQDMKAFAKKMEINMKALSQKKHLILLPKEAVIAGAHDYTHIIMQSMNERQDHEKHEKKENNENKMD